MSELAGWERCTECVHPLIKSNRKRWGLFPDSDESDVHQDAMLELLSDSRLSVKQAINRACCRIRSKHHQRRKRGLPSQVRLSHENCVPSRANVVKDVIGREAWRRLYEALRMLDEGDNLIWECRRSGQTYREIGAKLGKSHTYVRQREQVILAILARELEGFDTDDYLLTIIRYYLRALIPAKMLKVKGHISRCPRCRAKLLALKIAAEVNANERQR